MIACGWLLMGDTHMSYRYFPRSRKDFGTLIVSSLVLFYPSGYILAVSGVVICPGIYSWIYSGSSPRTFINYNLHIHMITVWGSYVRKRRLDGSISLIGILPHGALSVSL